MNTCQPEREMTRHDCSKPCPVSPETLVRIRPAGLNGHFVGRAADFRWQEHWFPYVVPVAEYAVLPSKQ